jgi:hypothetical protein
MYGPFVPEAAWVDTNGVWPGGSVVVVVEAGSTPYITSGPLVPEAGFVVVNGTAPAVRVVVIVLGGATA